MLQRSPGSPGLGHRAHDRPYSASLHAGRCSCLYSLSRWRRRHLCYRARRRPCRLLQRRPASGAYEIGYWVGKPYWGDGIATEAARALVDHLRAREPGCDIAISHVAENDASARVIQKLGFHPTGEKRTYYVARAREVRSLTYLYPQDDSGR
ncbi:MAG: GNAT family N-acetyltransferase, partial [Sphingomonadales bacterium]|nr:GNAT family N-acetyltransferase [Sphingomonadales bacterium]